MPTTGKPSWVVGPSSGRTATKSTLGVQPYSQRQSAPSYQFGTSQRSHSQKMYISEAHSRHQLPKTPGPGKYTPQSESLGKHSDSTMEDAARYGFGTASRFGALLMPGSRVLVVFGPCRSLIVRLSSAQVTRTASFGQRPLPARVPT